MSDEICVKFPVSAEKSQGYIKCFGPPKIDGALEIPIEKFPADLLQELLNTRHGIGLEVSLDRVWLTGGITINTSNDGTTISLCFEANDITITPAK